MAYAQYFKQLAERCTRLARQTHDLGCSKDFRELATELKERSEEEKAKERTTWWSFRRH